MVPEAVPDVVIFDMTDADQSDVLLLRAKNPHLLLIGLDVERNHAVLLRGQQAHSLSLEGVRQIVEWPGSGPREGRWGWRASLQSPHTGECEWFAKRQQLFCILSQRCKGEA